MCLGSPAKWGENGRALHFWVYCNSFQFLLYNFIWFCLQLVVLYWISGWNKSLPCASPSYDLQCPCFPYESLSDHLGECRHKIFPQVCDLKFKNIYISELKRESLVVFEHLQWFSDIPFFSAQTLRQQQRCQNSDQTATSSIPTFFCFMFILDLSAMSMNDALNQIKYF